MSSTEELFNAAGVTFPRSPKRTVSPAVEAAQQAYLDHLSKLGITDYPSLTPIEALDYLAAQSHSGTDDLVIGIIRAALTT